MPRFEIVKVPPAKSSGAHDAAATDSHHPQRLVPRPAQVPDEVASISHHRHDDTALRCHRDTDVLPIELGDRVVGEPRIDRGVLAQAQPRTRL